MGGGGQEAKEGVAAPFPRHKQAPTPGPHVLDPLSGAVPALRGTRGEGAAGATVAGRGCKDTLATEGLLEPAAPRGPRRSAPRMGGVLWGEGWASTRTHPGTPWTLWGRGSAVPVGVQSSSRTRWAAGCLTSGHCAHDAGLCCAPWDCPARPRQPSHPWPPSSLASQPGLRATAGLGGARVRGTDHRRGLGVRACEGCWPPREAPHSENGLGPRRHPSASASTCAPAARASGWDEGSRGSDSCHEGRVQIECE